MATTSDAALIASVACGDREAFGELYSRYGAPAYRHAKRVTIDPRLAEHVTQEVFLTIWREASRFDERRSRVATWLLTITHHKAVDVVRAEQLRRTESDDQINEIADESIDLPGEASQSERRNTVLAALAALNEARREVNELAYFMGYSQRRLADVLDLPLGTIKSRTHTALTHLRVSLDAAGMTTERVHPEDHDITATITSMER